MIAFLIAFAALILPTYSHAYPKQEKLVLITGCAHSGLNYLPRVFETCGLDVKYDRVGADGIASWKLAAVYQKPMKQPDFSEYRFKHIFHQVRNPLDNIAAATRQSSEDWKYIQSFIPQIADMDKNIVKAAKYWYYWNKKAEQAAELSYRVEDIEIAWDKISRHMGFPLDKSSLNYIPFLTQQISQGCTWAKLKKHLDTDLYMRIILLARHYGYSTEDHSLFPTHKG